MIVGFCLNEQDGWVDGSTCRQADGVYFSLNILLCSAEVFLKSVYISDRFPAVFQGGRTIVFFVFSSPTHESSEK